MRVLLVTIGTRGEVQPMVALASELKGLGQEVTLCVPPDFVAWIEGLGFPVVPIGPEVRRIAKNPRTPGVWPTPEQRRQLLEATITTQFATISAAAKGCDVIVAGGVMMIAAHSVAEQLEIRYVYVSFCPKTLPSPHHAPIDAWGPPPENADNRTLWTQDAQRWNDGSGLALNTHRAAAGLAPVTDVRGHMFTDRPWLAADPTVGPWPTPTDLDVVHTGAWMLADERPLPDELTQFLDAGTPPVYVGFGSMPATPDLGRALIESARALGRRTIVDRGWADLLPTDDGTDWLSIGDINHRALFPHVAAVVHHGGAGTTTAAARAGAPQVIMPQMYDQPYWAQQVDRLGIGSTADTELATALSHVLHPDIRARAKAVAAEVRTDGAEVAARLLVE